MPKRYRHVETQFYNLKMFPLTKLERYPTSRLVGHPDR